MTLLRRLRHVLLSILYLRCGFGGKFKYCYFLSHTFNSLFEMQVHKTVVYEVPSRAFTFNSLFEMPGLLVLGFCGFLSFCVGVCRFLVGAC